MVGLIERAVGQFDDGSTPGPARRESLAEADGSLEQETTFELDEAALHAGGFYAGSGARKNQTLELRAVKRALLKRMGMLRRMGRERRSAGPAGRDRNIVLVTSTRPGEGKTFVSINLALSFALEDRQPVLLIDGDAPRPKVRRHLNLPHGPGITDFLAEAARDPRARTAPPVMRAKDCPLWVMGEGTERNDATRLFASDAARAFFAELSARRPDRLIIIDAPPLLATTETFALARHADEIVFVVEADATPQPAIAVALEELLEINPNVSLVLNRCLIPAGGSHYGSYQQYEKTGSAADATADEGGIKA